MSGAKSGDDRAACTPLARRVPDFAPLIRATKKEKEAERRQTRISYLRAPTFILPRSRGRREEGARRASSGTRRLSAFHRGTCRSEPTPQLSSGRPFVEIAPANRRNQVLG